MHTHTNVHTHTQTWIKLEIRPHILSKKASLLICGIEKNVITVSVASRARMRFALITWFEIVLMRIACTRRVVRCGVCRNVCCSELQGVSI